jgi:hypothetical protein
MWENSVHNPDRVFSFEIKSTAWESDMATIEEEVGNEDNSFFQSRGKAISFDDAYFENGMLEDFVPPVRRASVEVGRRKSKSLGVSSFSEMYLPLLENKSPVDSPTTIAKVPIFPSFEDKPLSDSPVVSKSKSFSRYSSNNAGSSSSLSAYTSKSSADEFRLPQISRIDVISDLRRFRK